MNPLKQKMTMKTKKLLWAALSMTAALMMTACSSDDNDTTEAPVAPSTTKTIPYTVTVGGDEATTRASVDSDNKTLRFATGDKLYIWGENIQGVLDITDGVGSTDNATFSGELTYSGSGTPAANLELEANLVSAQQREGGQINIDEYGDVWVNTADANFCSSVSDAVQKYSWLTGTSTYGARAFTLTQQAAFLNFEITIDADLGEEVYAEVYDDDALLEGGFVPIVDDGGVKKAKFVLPVLAGTILSNATVKIGDADPIPFGTGEMKLKAKVYNVKGTVKPTLADALKEGSTVTVYFYHQYSTVGDPDYCTFYNTGDYGEDMFVWQSGSGFIGSDGNLGRQLIVDEDNENILIFKQNWGEGWVDIEDDWEENGFQVTFNMETKTYTQWYGQGVKTIVEDQWYNPSDPPSFVRLEVNGCDVTSELTESTESE